jgi:hypothetical protein
LVHHDSAHADEHVVVQGAAVHEGAVADADVVADGGAAFLVGAVEHRAVLDVHFVADADKIHVAAHHGLVPHGAVVAHGHIADDGGVFGEETVFPELGLEVAARNEEGHFLAAVCSSGWRFFGQYFDCQCFTSIKSPLAKQGPARPRERRAEGVGNHVVQFVEPPRNKSALHKFH